MGIVDRARSNQRLTVAIAAGGLVVLAWIGWTIYVTTDNGANAGLGVVLAWPLLLAALALVASPFVGIYLLVRRHPADEGGSNPEDSVTEEEEDDEDEDQDGPEDEDQDDSEAEDQDDSEDEDDSEEEPTEEKPAASG
jgi:hypothetical protein